MPRVICVLPHASDEISGVKFHELEQGGKISDEVSDEVAARFASIPGYSLDELVDEERKPAKEPEAPPPPKLTKAQQKALEKQQAAAKAAQEEAEKGAGNLVKAVVDVATAQQKAAEETGAEGGENTEGENKPAADADKPAGGDEEVF